MISPNDLKQPFWAMEVDQTIQTLQSDTRGLTSTEVGKRKLIFGTNTIPEKQRLTRTRIVLNQLRSPLIAVLGAAGVLTILLREWTDALVIFGAVTVNTFMGFWQENKAETVLEQLKSYIVTRARVRRAGEEHELTASDLVPGDLVRLAPGDRVPADGRLLSSTDLEIDESVLTGESLPTVKKTQALAHTTILPERASMVYAGTHVIQGFGDAIIVATGPTTEMGRIAALSATKSEEPTPLQRNVGRFSKQIGLGLGVLTVLLFLYGLRLGHPPVEMFLMAVAIAVSAVPEGLPVALTVILAVGVERLAKRKAVVRRLLAAETLGSTTVILTDKTGTLTQARMELVGLVPRGMDEKRMLTLAMRNIDVVIENPEAPPNEWHISGKGVEVALCRAAGLRGMLSNTSGILDRIPFDSRYKYSATLTAEGGEGHAIYLGAAEILVNASAMDINERNQWLMEIERRASTGERILGLASKTLSRLKRPDESGAIAHLEFHGLFAFRDPLRASVAPAMQRIGKAGVRTVILTGDHRGTAEAIGKALGLASKPGSIMTGSELHALKDQELIGRLPHIDVFARVTPEQKLRIAKLFQRRGDVVAMTGDGVNDAPTLQAADIGIAVGSGTEVAKSAADLVILDDNYETIVSAIEEGRGIMENIRTVIVYLLSNGLDEFLLIGGSLVAGLTLPLNALQILYVNFFLDSFPGVAFAFERSGARLDRPEDGGKRLLDAESRFLLFAIGTLGSIFLFIFYSTLTNLGLPYGYAQTLTFATLATYTLFAAFSLRNLREPIWRYNPFSNRALTIGAIVGLGFTLAAIYAPVLNRLLNTTPVPPIWLILVVGYGFAAVGMVEGGKWLFRPKPTNA
jgi:Ca2+-transporting ATPase